MKTRNPVEITIVKTAESNPAVDELIEKLCRTHRKYNVELTVVTKNGSDMKVNGTTANHKF